MWLEDAFVVAAATIPALNSPRFDISNMDVTFFAGVDDVSSGAIKNEGVRNEGGTKLVGAAMATQTGQVGTPTYMSPEQCRGGEISAATDVWALGLIAFKMLTGMTYWRAANRDEVSAVPLMFEITFEPIVAASARAAELGRPGLIPPKFDAWFSHCLARDAAARFTEGGEAARALMSVLELGEAAPIEMIAESAAPSGVVTERAASSALRANIDERSLAPVADPVTPTPRIYASPARAAISGTDATVAAPFGPPTPPRRPAPRRPRVPPGSSAPIRCWRWRRPPPRPMPPRSSGSTAASSAPGSGSIAAGMVTPRWWIR